MYCSKCGTQNSPENTYCANCGAPLSPQSVPAMAQYQAAPAVGRRTSGMAIAGMVLGILSFLLNFIWFIPSILAIIFSAIGLVQTGQGRNTGGRGMAIAGLICGIIAALIWIPIFVIFFAMPDEYYYSALMCLFC